MHTVRSPPGTERLHFLFVLHFCYYTHTHAHVVTARAHVAACDILTAGYLPLITWLRAFWSPRRGRVVALTTLGAARAQSDERGAAAGYAVINTVSPLHLVSQQPPTASRCAAIAPLAVNNELTRAFWPGRPPFWLVTSNPGVPPPPPPPPPSPFCF